MDKVERYNNYYPPRILYSSIFSWVAVTGGRFQAPFLEHEAGLSDSFIGTTVALKLLIGSCVGILAGSWADTLERKFRKQYGRGRGRILVVFGGVLCGTCVFCLHGMHYLFPLGTGCRHFSGHCDTFLVSPWWHLFVQLLYACSFAVVMPVTDGIALEYLKESNSTMDDEDGEDNGDEEMKKEKKKTTKKGGKTKNFGQERLYGAIWWAIVNLILGPSFDKFGFSISYPYALLAAICVFVTMALYIRGLDIMDEARRKSTGNNNRNCNESSSTESLLCTDDNNKDEEEACLVASDERRILKDYGTIEADCKNGRKQLPFYSSSESGDTLGSSSSDDEDDDGGERSMESKSAMHHSNNTRTTVTDSSTTREEEKKKDLSLVSLLRIVLGTVYGSSFVFHFVCLFSGTAVVENLVFLFFEYLGGSNTLCAVTVLLTVMFEIPLFQIAPKLLQYFGPSVLMMIASFCYITRVVGYTFVPQHHSMLVFFFEPLHGITYACAKLGGVEYVEQLMPLGYEASGQGILSLFQGIGSLSGLFLAGIIQEKFGPRIMYRLLATIVSVGLLTFSSVIVCSSRQRNRKENNHPTANQ